MTKVFAEHGNIVIEQVNPDGLNTVILTYAEADKPRERLIRAQIKINNGDNPWSPPRPRRKPLLPPPPQSSTRAHCSQSALC